MVLPGKPARPGEPLVQTAEEAEESTNREGLGWIALFVVATVVACLTVYLLQRPANRHFEPTPYDTLIPKLRSNMSEDDVLALFRSASDGNARAEIKAYDEVSKSGPRRVITYRTGSDEPLKVRLGGSTGQTAAEWCYRDHCHDNID
jgi:hypothetical protein